MIDKVDETIDYDEETDVLDIGIFLNQRPFQDGYESFLRTSTAEYQLHLDEIGIKHFSSEEVLFLGGSHHIPGHRCSNKNNIPESNLWSNMDATILELDALREQIGSPLFINSGYRNFDYNQCVGGASKSFHKQFKAIDFRSNTITPREVARTLRLRRDQGTFKGGIGIYNSFVHIDTRGENRSFKGRTTPMSDFEYVFS